MISPEATSSSSHAGLRSGPVNRLVSTVTDTGPETPPGVSWRMVSAVRWASVPSPAWPLTASGSPAPGASSVSPPATSVSSPGSSPATTVVASRSWGAT